MPEWERMHRNFAYKITNCYCLDLRPCVVTKDTEAVAVGYGCLALKPDSAELVRLSRIPRTSI